MPPPPFAPESFPLFEASLHRCLSDPTFVDRFYARFLLTHPDVARMFANTDLKKQGHALRASLYLVLRAAAGHDEGLAHLHEVGRSHGERKLGVKPEHYALWLDTLVTVAGEVDRHFDGNVEKAWRACLVPCIETIVGGQRGH